MKKFIDEFKDFAFRGNVLDLAVGVVIGSAFTAIVTALVNYIIMPLVGILTGGTNIKNLSIDVGGAKLEYGAFLQAVVDFILIALVIFIFIKIINNAANKFKKTEEVTKEVEIPAAEQYLKEIRDLLAEDKNKTNL
ncbi:MULTISPECIES: large conductance mechanosensitive channel protein MscL [Carnobacterium]|jgi:large conductance mechanosensitive channel|uniref:Large-conductance mechanosensitive channel n=2 Tax=Carnobacterium inhibens TaxID=147709 RepID=U5SAQ7_9LACT|nr:MULTISPECIES: large conductance mechanosensitive channel protein MscL [Carnobacterium]AGY80932.1 large conductance mechanosensitive channel protein MscL [Carnobacterium inhibens subsp. gilichinskyi]MBC9826044.1 large conductance mechanosensitive channel protein MscL [Carnobacterium inhibens]MCM3513262.1 large conductance mechanosensitive channel protein MscL [Carnobacterium inhibens]MDN5372617.1 large conductance mechanosensitive channel [Carnobacterium sp.]